MPLLCLAALGVVFGDIGTSPLYAFRESCMAMEKGLQGTMRAPLILGLLSLIIWSLITIISVKYIVFVMRADKNGEGGILALLNVGFPERKTRWRTRTGKAMVAFGVSGAALLYSDGVITPAISVLSAVEGVKGVAPGLAQYVVPITAVILIVFFGVQRFGTAKIGGAFGPITLVWFTVLGILGIKGIADHPQVLHAFSPHHAVNFLYMGSEWGISPMRVLGGVFLVVTGGEALYADMGHLGRKPIRITWFAVVLPALILNYLGQGAGVIYDTELATYQGEHSFFEHHNPFYAMCPDWFRLPLVILATMATVIASQALITGAFSLTVQAVQMGYLPRIKISHTSHKERGQIYIGKVNWVLAVLCILLVCVYGSSSKLAHMYGMGVSLTMLVTTVLFYYVARRQWEWPVWKALSIVASFGLLELVFVGSNLLKFLDGAWVPLVLALMIFIVMVTWRTGRRILSERLKEQALPLDEFVASMARGGVHKVPGTAIYMAGATGLTPTALLHNLKHNKVLHQRIVFLTIETQLIPFVDHADRITVEIVAEGIWRVVAHYGFMEHPDVPKLLEQCAGKSLSFNSMQTSFFLGRETIVPTNKHLSYWRAKLFSILSRNAQSAVAYYKIPPSRVVEFGIQIEL